MDRIVTVNYRSNCPYRQRQQNIKIKYFEMPLAGTPRPEYKKRSFSCDYEEECPCIDNHDGCPVYQEAPKDKLP